MRDKWCGVEPPLRKMAPATEAALPSNTVLAAMAITVRVAARWGLCAANERGRLSEAALRSLQGQLTF
jgi:hypothetical protein